VLSKSSFASSLVEAKHDVNEAGAEFPAVEFQTSQVSTNTYERGLSITYNQDFGHGQ
jgi:hypothetical protein